MKRILYCIALLLFGSSMLMSAQVSAAQFQVKIVDQQGKAIENAVVINPQTKVSRVNTEPAIMDQADKAFVPLVIAVEQGRAVAFPNSDNIRHHVYSFSKAKRFTIKLYANRPEAPVVFDKPGIVVLGCNIHDSMVGYILVSEWQDFSVSNDKGMAELDMNMPTAQKLLVWHPWSENVGQLEEVELGEASLSGDFRISLNIKRPSTQAPKKKYDN